MDENDFSFDANDFADQFYSDDEDFGSIEEA